MTVVCEKTTLLFGAGCAWTPVCSNRRAAAPAPAPARSSRRLMAARPRDTLASDDERWVADNGMEVLRAGFAPADYDAAALIGSTGARFTYDSSSPTSRRF